MIELHHQWSTHVDPRLVALTDRHGSEGHRLYLEELRWPAGARCPRCEAVDVHWLERRRRYSCRRCKYQFRVTAGTVFHDSHLSIRKWLVAVSLMLSGEGVSARQLQRILGGSYKSAWFLEHRIRSAMAAPQSFAGPIGYARADAPAGSGPAPRSDEAAGSVTPAGWRLLRSLIAGGHGFVAQKYLAAYWDETLWRDANRSNPNAFRDTVRALLEHPWLPFDTLVRGDVVPA